MIVNSESCFIGNENKEYKDCDINDQVRNEYNNYTKCWNYW
jgi:hypothetical protein